MAQKFTTLRRYLFLLVLLAAAGNARADAGKELFDEQCASCHTIGGGDSGGPDLKGITAKRSPDWLIRVIAEPEKLTAEKDPIQLKLIEQYGFEMPNVGVSRSDAEKILAYLAGGGNAAPASGAGEAPPAEAPKQAELVVTKELLAAGHDLFTGKQRFVNGGASCVSCHALRYPGISNGTLSADLTDLHEKMGENGVRGVLKSLSFPVMKKIYAERPLNEEEITALTALFKDAAAKKHVSSDPYPLAGLGFFVLCLVAAILFKRRIK